MSIPDPVVLLDARARYVHPAFEMARASTKTVWDSAGRLVAVPANALGWDHDPTSGKARGYLVEPSATNLLLHSNDLTQGVWVKTRSSVTPDAITGPDGDGMDKLVETIEPPWRAVRQSFAIAEHADIVCSAIFRAAEHDRVTIWCQEAAAVSNNFRASFNLSDGTTTGGGASNDAVLLDRGIWHLGGGFYRAWVAGRLGAGVTTARFEVRLPEDVEMGDGTSGFYMGYAQAEEGLRPSSYIPSEAATATRAQDALTTAVANFLWGRGNRGTMVLETDIEDLQEGAVLWSWGNGMVVRVYALGDDLRVSLIGTVVNSFITLTHELGRHVIAIAWDRESIRAAVNGELKPGSTLSAPGSATDMGIGCRFTGQDAWRSPIFRAVYYPARLSNADLQSLTAIQE